MAGDGGYHTLLDPGAGPADGELRQLRQIESGDVDAAAEHGRDAEQLVKDTVARMLENQNRFIAGVQRGIEQAGRGEFVAHKDVVNRIDRLFQS